MTDKVLCRYYMEGACRFGSSCAFSHNLKDAPSMVCRYWTAGYCKYGDKCHYDHVRVGRRAIPAPAPAPAPFTSTSRPATQSVAELPDIQALRLGVAASCPEALALPEPGSPSLGWTLVDDDAGAAPDPWAPALEAQRAFEARCAPGAGGAGARASAPRAAAAWSPLPSVPAPPLPSATPHLAAGAADACLSYFMRGECARGAACTQEHGDRCAICERWALSRRSPAQRLAHAEACLAARRRAESRARSAALECGVCLERVVDKATPSARRFGLLACDHVFCLACVRSWRAQAQIQGRAAAGDAAGTAAGPMLDVQGAVRCCPVCRTPCHFVTPSPVFPASAEDKEAIVSKYREHLLTVDCAHFDLGRGECPFGVACHYRHVLEDGTLADRTPPRLAAADEGDVRVIKGMTLADCIVVRQAKKKPR